MNRLSICIKFWPKHSLWKKVRDSDCGPVALSVGIDRPQKMKMWLDNRASFIEVEILLPNYGCLSHIRYIGNHQGFFPLLATSLFQTGLTRSRQVSP